MQVLSFPVFISLFSIKHDSTGPGGRAAHSGIDGAARDIDENLAGHSADVIGAIEFDNVTFKFTA